jgi:hypothetical protein
VEAAGIAYFSTIGSGAQIGRKTQRLGLKQ